MAQKAALFALPDNKPMGRAPRVGVFQANWSLQQQTVNLVRMLAASGYAVDVFFFNVPQHLASLEGELSESVNVFQFSRTDVPVNGGKKPSAVQPAVQKGLKPWLRQRTVRNPSVQRMLSGVVRAVYDTLRPSDPVLVIPQCIFDQARDAMIGQEYRCLIGVEQMGLVWAGAMAQAKGIPSIYFSLELYTRDYPGETGRGFARLKRLESHYHQQSQATIIQDEERANVLFRDTRTTSPNLFLIPVSLLGPAIKHKTTYLHQTLNIPADKKIVLGFGNMTGDRFAQELVKAAQMLPEQWVLVLHGKEPGDDVRSRLDSLNTLGRAIISTRIIPANQIGELIASADIGLALYSNATTNDYLTGKASEKMAYYARAGVPMIAFDYPSFAEVFSKYGCGRCISTIDGLPTDVSKIFADYETYRQGAFHAYEEVYEFSRHFSKFKDWVDSLEVKRLADRG